MPSFEIMDGNGNTKEFDINKIKSAKDVAQALKDLLKVPLYARLEMF